MKFLAGILIAVLLLGSVGTGHAAVRIGNDRGGRIGDYIDKFRHLRDTGELVIIDGLCAGACTIVLGAISRDKICLTSNARFGFKAAWDLGADGHQVVNPGATKTLYSVYPCRSTALDCAAGRLDRAYDLPSGQGAPRALSALLSRRLTSNSRQR